MKTTLTSRIAPALVALAALLTSAATADRALAGDPNANSVVGPLNEDYGVLAGEWWKWALSMPINEHPLYDTADCSEGQPFDDVWFLGGTFTSTEFEGVFIGEAERTCEVPAGTALFFPIINIEASALEGNGDTEEELRAAANFLADGIDSGSCELDGETINNVLHYRSDSPLFTFGPLPANNVLKDLQVRNANKGATSEAVAAGVHLLLAPLPPGEHTLHFTGTANFTVEEFGFDFHFLVDVTYHLIVE